MSISPSTSDRLPATVRTALAKMPDEQQLLFEDEYKRKSKSSGSVNCISHSVPYSTLPTG